MTTGTVREATLYIDESGSFAGTPLPLGLRLLGGVVLAGNSTSHAHSLRPQIKAAFEWWPGAWHAVEVGSTVKVAFALRKRTLSPKPALALQACAALVRGLPPNRVAALRWESPKAFHTIAGESARLLRQTRKLVGSACEEFSPASVILAMEHDMNGSGSRYGVMLQSVIQGGLLWLARHAGRGQEASLTVVVASGPANGILEKLDTETLARQLAERFPMAPKVTIQPPMLADAQKEPGLVLADLTVHCLGPGSDANTMIPRARARSKDLRSLNKECTRRLGATTGPVTYSPWAMDELRSLLQKPGSSASAMGQVLRQDPEAGRLAAGSFRCVEEQLLLTLDWFEEWRK